MPRCQRTLHRLEPLGEVSAQCWVCPRCPERERYAAVSEADLLEYLRFARDACQRDFGKAGDAHRPMLLLSGLRPECFYDPEERRYCLFVQAECDPWQLRLQIGHEVFHRVCGGGRVFHWVHEMLACVVSVRLLRERGHGAYAEQMDAHYRGEAERFPAEDLVTADPLATGCFPTGYYGRAYVTGVDLIQAVGWGAVCPLGRLLTVGSIPNIRGWLHTLSPEKREEALAILPSPFL